MCGYEICTFCGYNEEIGVCYAVERERRCSGTEIMSMVSECDCCTQDSMECRGEALLHLEELVGGLELF